MRRDSSCLYNLPSANALQTHPTEPTSNSRLGVVDWTLEDKQLAPKWQVWQLTLDEELLLRVQDSKVTKQAEVHGPFAKKVFARKYKLTDINRY